MLQTRFISQTTYVMRLTQFCPKQCHKLDVQLNRTFLPLLIINRNMPRAVVHGPLELGGINLPTKHLALQDQWNIHFVIQTLRWDKITAKDILTAFNAYQICSGFVSHVLICTELIIDYVGNGFINHLRSRLRDLKGKLHVEKAWRPKKQRVDNESIMELICDSQVTKVERRRASDCIKYVKVITVADLADTQGNMIPSHRLKGCWRATPDNNRLTKLIANAGSRGTWWHARKSHNRPPSGPRTRSHPKTSYISPGDLFA